jgi:hypothetical protein
MHRDLGAAVTKIDENGRIVEEKWFLKGKMLNPHFPSSPQISVS